MALQLPRELEQRLAALAQTRDRAPLAVLGDLIGEAEEQEARDSELGEAIAEMEAGGGHTHDDVMGELQAILDRAGGATPGR